MYTIWYTHTQIVVWIICIKHVFHGRLNIYKGKDFIFSLGMKYLSYIHTPTRVPDTKILQWVLSGCWDYRGFSLHICILHNIFVYFLKRKILILENALHICWVKKKDGKSCVEYNPIFVTYIKKGLLIDTEVLSVSGQRGARLVFPSHCLSL